MKDPKYKPLKTRWKKERKVDYANAYSDINLKYMNDKLDSLDIVNLCQSDLDSVIDELNNLLIEPAKVIGICKPAFNSDKHVKHGTNTSTSNDKPWFNKECETQRKEYLKTKRRLKSLKTDEAKLELKNKSRDYKRFIRRILRNYNKILHESLCESKSNNPKVEKQLR